MTNQTEVHFEGKIAQKGVIERAGKVLVIRDPRMEREIWEIPGGRLNEGEEPKSGLARELFEELGINCQVHEVIYMSQFLQGSEGKNALMIAYRVTVEDNAEFVLQSGEVSEIRWVTKDEADKMEFFPEYTATLKCYFADKH
jgi:8-oxo-dGTP pyrophosphatase MutT (NUDIX family)